MTIKRKTLLLFLPLLMLACKTLFPVPAPEQSPTATTAPTHPAPKTPTPRPIQAATATEADTPTTAPKGSTFVRLNSDDGNLYDLLAAEAQKAAKLGQLPVVEFDAPW